MSQGQATLSASVPPPANVASSAAIRGLPEADLEISAAEILARLQILTALDPDSTSAAAFFSAFEQAT